MFLNINNLKNDTVVSRAPFRMVFGMRCYDFYFIITFNYKKTTQHIFALNSYSTGRHIFLSKENSYLLRLKKLIVFYHI